MALASSSGYSAPLDLKLGAIPSTTNPAHFNEFMGIYNALHILNAYLTNIKNVLQPGNPKATPAESLAFQRYFWATAVHAMSPGNLCTPYTNGSTSGMVLGCGIGKSATPGEFPIKSVTLGANPDRLILTHHTFTGIALTSAAPGEKFKVGIGPGILNLPGIVAGASIWGVHYINSRGRLTHDGAFYSSAPSILDSPFLIGRAVTTDYVLFDPFHADMSPLAEVGYNIWEQI